MSVEDSTTLNPSLIPTAVLVCTASLVQRLNQERIPTHFVGVRTLRDALRRQGKPPTGLSAHTTPTAAASITYKVVNPDGTERRMTSQEKKAARNKMMEDKKKAVEALKKQQQEEEEEERETKKQKTTITPQHDNDNDEEGYPCPPPSSFSSSSSAPQQPQREKYHQLSINKEVMEEELADRRDRREGRPPVLLSRSMALVASALLGPETTVTVGSSLGPSATIQYDHTLSQNWAKSLKDSMRPAEMVRETEDMRPMAYTLMPEAWTRLRLERNITHPTLLRTKIHPDTFVPLADSTISPATNDQHHVQQQQRHNHAENHISGSSSSWIPLPCRPSSGCLDVATTVVLDYLYQETEYHVSCGAKFGADFLLYDGPRSQRHAFGELRIVVLPPAVPGRMETPPPQQSQPHTTLEDVEVRSNPTSTFGSTSSSRTMPSAYELAAYVRCLNTAGKLALLATVEAVVVRMEGEEEEDIRKDDKNDDDQGVEDTTKRKKEDKVGRIATSYKVAFVDVALEKILTAPTHRRSGRSEKRRDVAKNLAK